ncbi:hypothetical protein [Halobellus inordinatus]|uniref:hypothetical protein n=1 Tax=Halobellus inordinatus TaxID=1126236 RepID=UPI00211540B7|nr:hypothetical protein [Halobellus ramosii]
MTSAPLELVPELLEVLFFSLGSVGLSLVGASLERFALTTAQGGEVTLGLWAAVIGAVALYFAYYVAVDKALPTITEFKRALGDAAE